MTSRSGMSMPCVQSCRGQHVPGRSSSAAGPGVVNGGAALSERVRDACTSTCEVVAAVARDSCALEAGGGNALATSGGAVAPAVRAGDEVFSSSGGGNARS